MYKYDSVPLKKPKGDQREQKAPNGVGVSPSKASSPSSFLSPPSVPKGKGTDLLPSGPKGPQTKLTFAIRVKVPPVGLSVVLGPLNAWYGRALAVKQFCASRRTVMDKTLLYKDEGRVYSSVGRALGF